MSTNDLDRDFEKIDQKGWQLENYKVNPIVLWSHDRKIPAIGYAENVKADGALADALHLKLGLNLHYLEIAQVWRSVIYSFFIGVGKS